MDSLALTAAAQSYRERGYAVVRAVWSSAELAALTAALAVFLREVAPTLGAGDIYREAGSNEVKSAFRLHAHAKLFRQLQEAPRLTRLAGAVIGTAEVVPEGVCYFAKAARIGSPAPPHQDNAFQCYDPPEALVCTIAVDASTPDNGALTVLAGSHRLGLLAHRASGVPGFSRTLTAPVDRESYPAVQLCLSPGDVCLHHVNTVHCSAANRSAASRRQLAVLFRSARARRDPAAWERYQAELRLAPPN